MLGACPQLRDEDFRTLPGDVLSRPDAGAGAGGSDEPPAGGDAGGGPPDPLGSAARIAALAQSVELVWVLGNHDPAPPDGLPGTSTDALTEGPLTFRHDATGRPGEISGHLHPKASVATRGKWVSRACFVADARRVLLPAFGAYTGGLDIRDPAIARLFPRGARAFLLGRGRLYGFTLGQLHQHAAG